jgi:hypothetical protein
VFTPSAAVVVEKANFAAQEAVAPKNPLQRASALTERRGWADGESSFMVRAALMVRKRSSHNHEHR